MLLVEPGSFHAKGCTHIVEQNGIAWYYGILEEDSQEDEGKDKVSFYA